MKIESITFDTRNDRIVVEASDGVVTTFTRNDLVEYLAQFPDRKADLIAMGWVQNAGIMPEPNA